jgi:hypothetical protein
MRALKFRLAVFVLLVIAAGAALAATYKSKIEGEFEGWDGETIVQLANGQVWRQVSYYYEYRYAYMPDVVVYQDGRKWMMHVEGTRKAVEVEQLR